MPSGDVYKRVNKPTSLSSNTVIAHMDPNYWTALDTTKALPMFSVAITNSTTAQITEAADYPAFLGDFWVMIDASDINPNGGRKGSQFFRVHVQ